MGDFYLGTSRGSRTFSNPETTGSSNDLAGLLLPNNNDAAGSPDGSGDYEPPRRLSPRRMSTGSRLRKSRISEGSGECFGLHDSSCVHGSLRAQFSYLQICKRPHCVVMAVLPRLNIPLTCTIQLVFRSGVLGVRSNMPSAHYPVNGNGRMLVNT